MAAIRDRPQSVLQACSTKTDPRIFSLSEDPRVLVAVCACWCARAHSVSPQRPVSPFGGTRQCKSANAVCILQSGGLEAARYSWRELYDERLLLMHSF